MTNATLPRLAAAFALLVASAPAMAGPADLPSERPLLVQATVAGRYDRLPGEVDGGRLGLTARALIGQRLAYCAGIDLDAGASAEGAMYGAELLLAGAGLRLGDTGLIALCGGVGVGGAAGVYPAALQLPVELRVRAQLGPVRLAGWATARWIALAGERDGGSRVDAVDEVEATIALGLGSQLSYWGRASAGSGPYLAATYRELLGERVFSLALGIELLGAR